jgi:hypothetical protein
MQSKAIYFEIYKLISNPKFVLFRAGQRTNPACELFLGRISFVHAML